MVNGFASGFVAFMGASPVILESNFLFLSLQEPVLLLISLSLLLNTHQPISLLTVLHYQLSASMTY